MSNEFSEIFEVELKCWCIGLERVRERVDIGVLHKVIKDFAPVLKEAIENNYVFDLVETAKRLVISAKCRNNEREIVFYLLSHLPIPAELSSEQVKILEQIVQNVEQKYAGAIKRLEKKWHAQPTKPLKKPDTFTLSDLCFPPKSLSQA